MKFKTSVTVFLGIFLLGGVSFSTKASLISFNGENVGVLDLNGQVNNFTQFYNYNRGSANTGLEVVNTVVLFIAELNGEYGIFTIVNKYGAGGMNGNLNVNFASTSGGVSFTDDEKEAPTANDLVFSWAGNLTDGFIFSGMDYEFSLGLSLSSMKGVEGLQFINFSDGTLQSAEYSNLMALDNRFSIQTVINAPSILLTFAISLFGLLRLRK